MDLTKIHLPLRDPSICLPSGIGKTHETSSVPRHYPGEALDLQHLDGSKDLGMRDSPQKGDQAEALFYLDKRSKHILVPESLDAKKGPNHPTIRAVRDILRFCLPQGKSPNKNTIDMETPIFFSLEDMEDSDSHTLKAELLVAHSISHPFSCQVEKSKCTKVQNPMDFGVS
jgi:hypothetical protein